LYQGYPTYDQAVEAFEKYQNYKKWANEVGAAVVEVVKAKEEMKNGHVIDNKLGTTIIKKDVIIVALDVIVVVQLIVIFKH
jgi:hypothetical protein